MKRSIEFIPLSADHLSLIWNWLKEPHVKEFWQESDDEIIFRKKYLKKITDKGVFAFVISIGECPMGYIQYYDAEKFGVTIGIDLFIGNPLMVGKGYGTKIIHQFIEKFLKKPNVKEIIVDPDPKNFRAIRAYEKVGFKRKYLGKDEIFYAIQL